MIEIEKSAEGAPVHPAVRGYLERIDLERCQGWVFCASNQDVTLEIKLANQVLKLEPAWVERSDVAEKFGAEALRSGFVCRLSPATAFELECGWEDDSSFAFLANGTPLPLATGILPPKMRVAQELLRAASAGVSTEPIVRSWGGFAVLGQVNDIESKTLRVALDGKEYDLTSETVWCPMREETDKTPIAFECPIPGWLWEEVPEGEPMRLTFCAGSQTRGSEPLLLTRHLAARWVDDIAKMVDGKKRQFHALLALEHVRFGAFAEFLSDGGQQFLTAFARQMKLEHYLPSAFTLPDADRPDPDRVLHSKALRELNDRLAEAKDAEAVFASVRRVVESMNVKGEVLNSFLDSVTPTLCKWDIYESLSEIADLHRVREYRHCSDCWRLTLALPALVVEEWVPLATETLWKLSRHLDQGWINSECIHFAVREVGRLRREELIPRDIAEGFQSAFIGVLDAFKGEWFSRLHDLELIRAGIALLEDRHDRDELFRRDLVKGLIRNFGLCPAFWKELESCQPPDPELGRAKFHWRTLEACYQGKTGPLLASGAGVRYFQRLGNREIVVFVRELIMANMPRLGASAPAIAGLVGLLLEDGDEGVRLAAHPLLDHRALADRYPECGDILLETLRRMTPCEKRPMYATRLEAGRLAQRVADAAAAQNDLSLDKDLDELAALIPALTDGTSDFLGVDLRTFVYERKLAAALPAEKDLSWIAEILRTFIGEADTKTLLPAPIQAALARLIRLSRKDGALRTFLEEFAVRLRKKFGDRYDCLFERRGPPALPFPEEGFHADTLVAVYSCRKYLEPRISAIRATWLRDLKARGIPYVILVGDGNDTLDGDILALDVPDTYEALPRKTLKLVDWVWENTEFQYLYKIDDDCYLDVERFFGMLGYRTPHYYGRVVHRKAGSMDRAWHRLKSRDEQARKSLDKSPEPAVYASGGGYSLSRQAMRLLRDASRGKAGQHLIAVSYMEDKLVGDLLALRQIAPSGDDYDFYVRYLTFGATTPVGIWDNTFFPTADTPTVVAHLDVASDHDYAHRLREAGGLWPKRVWPTCLNVSLRCMSSNQLELITETERLRALAAEPFAVVGAVRNEMLMLPHFLKHYRRLGARAFFIVDNLSDDGTREYLLEQQDVALFSADTEYRNSHYGVSWQQAILGNFCVGKWVLLADADELLVYPGCEDVPIRDYLAAVEAEAADGVRVDMIDMYPFGDLDDADFSRQDPFAAAPWMDRKPLLPWRLGSGRYSNAISFTSALRHRLSPNSDANAFTSQKYALFRYRPWVRLSEGLHYAQGLAKIAAQPAWFAHFKYHAGFKAKAEGEVRRGQHFDNAKDYGRYLGILAENKGGFGDERFSRKYESSQTFMNDSY